MIREVVTPKQSKLVLYSFNVEYRYKDIQFSCSSRDNFYNRAVSSDTVLEVSTAGLKDCGRMLSAFNLEFDGYPLESYYHSLKMNEDSLDNTYLRDLSPVEAKKATKTFSSKLVGVRLPSGIELPISELGDVYTWIYMQAAMDSPYIKEALDYEAFADIFFDPNKSNSCQARALGLIKLLRNENLLSTALFSYKLFKEVSDNRILHMRY